MIIPEQKARELISLPRNFDLGLIDQVYGFEQKIFPLVGKSTLEGLQQHSPDIYDYFARAGLYYSLVLDLPKIKVHLSNYGINQYEQGTTKNANWWDVRDLALTWLKKADFFLGEGLSLLSTNGENFPFREQEFTLVKFTDREKYLGKVSPEVYLNLSGLMQKALADFLSSVGECAVEQLQEDEYLLELIRRYCVERALLEALQEQTLMFITGGIVVQYEELPWQKSVVLNEKAKTELYLKYLNNTEQLLTKIWDYINANRAQFPCLGKTPIQQRIPIIKGKGGLFL